METSGSWRVWMSAETLQCEERRILVEGTCVFSTVESPESFRVERRPQTFSMQTSSVVRPGALLCVATDCFSVMDSEPVSMNSWETLSPKIPSAVSVRLLRAQSLFSLEMPPPLTVKRTGSRCTPQPTLRLEKLPMTLFLPSFAVLPALCPLPSLSGSISHLVVMNG